MPVYDLAELVDRIRALGPPYRVRGELLRVAVRGRNGNAIIRHLIHVLEKLEKGTE